MSVPSMISLENCHLWSGLMPIRGQHLVAVEEDAESEGEEEYGAKLLSIPRKKAIWPWKY